MASDGQEFFLGCHITLMWIFLISTLADYKALSLRFYKINILVQQVLIELLVLLECDN